MKLSNKFDAPAFVHEGIYYFPGDIKASDKREGKPFEIQAVFYERGKYRQDTFYISEGFKVELETKFNQIEK